MEILTLEKVSKQNEKCRIDKYLAERITELTRSHIQKLIEEQEVFVNGKVVKSNYKLRESDEIVLHLPVPKILAAKAEKIPLDIVYEDENLLVVNKPQGMVVHPAYGNFEGTLVNALMAHCRESLSQINGIIRPGIVHRIDKDTSGLLLIAKDNETHLSLAQQIKDHSVNRRYMAVTIGIVKEEEGTVNAPIGRDPKNRKKMAIVYQNSKEAITHYRVMERFEGYTLIECKLETGRTHQIRVHMASLNKPILGDPVYGPKNNKRFPHLIGQLLHAYQIGFIHPKTGEYMEFSKEPPELFQQVLEKLRNITK